MRKNPAIKKHPLFIRMQMLSKDLKTIIGEHELIDIEFNPDKQEVSITRFDNNGYQGYEAGIVRLKDVKSGQFTIGYIGPLQNSRFSLDKSNRKAINDIREAAETYSENCTFEDMITPEITGDFSMATDYLFHLADMFQKKPSQPNRKIN